MLKSRNLIVMLALDSILILLCFYASYAIRFEFNIPKAVSYSTWKTAHWLLGIKLFFFWRFGLYKGMWRYTSISDLINIIKAMVISSLVLITAFLMAHRFQGYPRSVFVIDLFLSIIAIGGARVLIRMILTGQSVFNTFNYFKTSLAEKAKKIIIIGAGDGAEYILREIKSNPNLGMMPICLMDDDPQKLNKSIHGIPVLGGLDELVDLKIDYDEIIIAIPSAKGDEMRRIVNLCKETGKPFRTVPNIGELIGGRISLKAVRNVRVEDLLGREQVQLDEAEIANYLKNKRVLVTGAGGSIGSELVKQIGCFAPEALCLMEISELNLYKVEIEFKSRFPDINTVLCLGDIRDGHTVEEIYRNFKPNVVFHAAAYKHVPMQEHFPWEAINNNILGTYNMAEAARRYDVDRFVLVSTDKAVRPTNVMGTTKRIAELIIVGLNEKSDSTRFMAVRFGNVLGSSGSAIPLFEKQIANGGPVTVTHADVTRYFMSVGEAAQLILQCGSQGNGGEIFILEMGEPIKIYELAKDMIKLHGYEPDEDIEIKIVGLRPGEKLYEELITEGEGITATPHEKIMVLKSSCAQYELLLNQIYDLLETAQSFDKDLIKRKLREIVPEYHNPDDLEDISKEELVLLHAKKYCH